MVTSTEPTRATHPYEHSRQPHHCGPTSRFERTSELSRQGSRQHQGVRRAVHAVLATSISLAAITSSAATTNAAPALGTIATAVGTIGDGGPAATAYAQTSILASDAAGNLYFPDDGRVRRIDGTTHVITTIAGTGLTTSTGDGGLAVDASLRAGFIVAAANGDLYISDPTNSNVRKIIKATGVIVNVAGTGVAGTTGDGGQATTAQLNLPIGLALDSTGLLYIADAGSSRIRKVAANGIITTVAGTGAAGFNSNGQQGTATQLNFPESIAFDAGDNMYISDSNNNRIRKLTATTGIVTTIAGTSGSGFNGDGAANTATLNQPQELAYSNNFVYFADQSNHRIRRIGLLTNSIFTLAGTGVDTSTGNGGPAANATVSYPTGVAVVGTTVYVTDQSSTIRAITGVGSANVTMTHFAGVGFPFAGDGGPASNAILGHYAQVAVGLNGDLYINDAANARVRRVDKTTGIITTVAGTGVTQFNGDGPIATTNLQLSSIAADTSGNVYVAQEGYAFIRKVNVAAGTVTTVAGTGGQMINGDGPALTKNVTPSDLVINSAGDLYIADRPHGLIRKLTIATGTLTTIAGTGTLTYNGDGPIATTNLDPGLIAVDAAGDIYMTDNTNAIVRKITIATGQVTTVVGTGATTYNGDHTGLTTNIDPFDIAVDAAGNIYITDYAKRTVRRYDAATTQMSTVAGTGVAGSSGDGGPATSARFTTPTSIALGPIGQLYIVDQVAQRVRVMTVPVPPAPQPPTPANPPTPAYNPVTPERLLDTRIGVGAAAGKLGAGTTLVLQVTGAGTTHVPTSATAVALNVTVTEPDAPGFLTVWPCGSPQPLASNVNYVAGQTIPNLVVAKLGTGGTVCIIGQVTTHVVADINGWFSPSATYTPVAPERLLDTREGVGAAAGQLQAGTTLALQITGAGATSIPSNATAVAINVTVTDPAADGYLTIWPCGSPQPLASNLNYMQGQTIANLVIAKLGSAGSLCIAGQSTAHIVADVNGWFAQTAAFSAVAPERLLDTREGVGAIAGKLDAGLTLTLQIAGAGTSAIPGGATAVIINVTVTDPAADGYLTIWPCDAPQPLASNLNYTHGQTIPNLVISKLGTGGTICITGQATTHIVADVNGWFG